MINLWRDFYMVSSQTDFTEPVKVSAHKFSQKYWKIIQICCISNLLFIKFYNYSENIYYFRFFVYMFNK